MSEFLLYIDREFLKQRIMEKVTINSDGCWLYEGHDDGKGYKKISILGRSYYVHRIMYILFGAMPHLKPRHDLDHNCLGSASPGNRACCNPDHLIPRTRLSHNRKTHKGKTRSCRKTSVSQNNSLPESSSVPMTTAPCPSASSISQECATIATAAQSSLN